MPHQNIVLHELTKYLPWGVHDRLVEEHGGDDPRALSSKAHLTGMLYGQFANAQSLREIEAALRSHAAKLYHLGARPVSRSTLAEANASRPVEIFGGVLEALMKQLQRGCRRKVGDCLRLIDSTSVRLTSFSRDWATFSAGVCGAKAHIVYDPDAVQPVYLQITKANVNDITAAQAMPVEAGATYVFDLGYYDYSIKARYPRRAMRLVGEFASGGLPDRNAAQGQYAFRDRRRASGSGGFRHPWRPDRISPQTAGRLAHKIRCRILCAKCR